MKAASLIVILCVIGGILIVSIMEHFINHSGNGKDPAEVEPTVTIVEIGGCGLDKSLCVYEDTETGCHYIRVASTGGGLVPRLRADGSVWCGTNEGSL